MKRLSILLVLLLIAVGFYYFSIDREDHKLSVLNAERAFKIEAAELSKIIISERNKKPILLSRTDNNLWQLNQKYLVRKNAIDNLLDVIENIEIKYIPLQQAHKNILDEIKLIGVQVDLYDANDTRLKSYQVGGSTPDERGTYCLMSSNTQKPFAVHIPSMEGSIRGRFILSEQDWRDRSVINGDPSQLKYIRTEYPGQMQNSFTIKNNDNQSLEVLGADATPISADPNKVRAYVESFDEVYAEYIDNLNPLRDSITSLQPFVEISFGKSEDEFKSIRLFPLSDLIFDEDKLTDADKVKLDGRYFVDCSWGDFMLVQHRLIGKLLRGKSFFETE